MDKGRPFRVPQPADRRVMSRPEAPQVMPEASEAPRMAPAAARPEAAPVVTSHRGAREPKVPKKRLLWPLITLGVIVLAFLGWFAWSNLQNAGTAIDGSKYQAVFFTNGQVYFGKLHPFNHDYMKLTDIYYLQTQTSTGTDSKNPQATTSGTNGTPTLIKLGGEVHGPEDMMMIAKDQLLFYENLKPDGTVVKSILKEKGQN